MSFDITSPHDGKTFRTLRYTTQQELETILDVSVEAQRAWSIQPVQERIDILNRGIQKLLDCKSELADELTRMIGRPIRYAPKEIEGFAARGTYLLSVAAEQLEPIVIENSDKAIMKIVKEPIGVVLIIGAWNYPYLVVVNTLIPALAAGNSVIIKHAPQTALVANSICQAFHSAGLHLGILASVNVDNSIAEKLVSDPRISYVSLVGSIRAGQAVLRAASHRPTDFIKVSLELGGCDAAYVRNDADLKTCISKILDGVVFNSGQSCCGVQRIFVHEERFDEFLDHMEDCLGQEIRIGDPSDERTTIGPLVSLEAADHYRKKIAEDKLGSKYLEFPLENLLSDSAYVAPIIFYKPTKDMNILREEIFGPAAAICVVKDDEEAIRRINDSTFGLTASIWTKDVRDLGELATKLKVGTVFVNQCDSPYPGLPWGGQKLSGLGFSLSKLAYDQVTRPKSINMKLI